MIEYLYLMAYVVALKLEGAILQLENRWIRWKLKRLERDD